jgi:cysteinyl-tRNA synthetase
MQGKARGMTDQSAPLTLFNSLTRALEPFVPVHPGEARVYSCGPTVYNYPHIGNMRAYVFADVLGRTLSWKGYKLTHVINITDVGHLTDDADAGEDKLEKAAKANAQSIWDIARHYTQAYWADIDALGIRQPAHWSIATDYVPAMIEFARSIADKHCYELPGGLYFDVSTVADYGKLARAATDEGEGRIEQVEGKRHQADFAIWRKTPPGETRQMEWDSPGAAARRAGIWNARSCRASCWAFRSTSTPAGSITAKSTIPTRSRRTRRSAAPAASPIRPIPGRGCGCTTISWSNAPAR